MDMEKGIANPDRHIRPRAVLVAGLMLLTACPTAPVNNSPGQHNGNTHPDTPIPTRSQPDRAPVPTPESGSLATPSDAYRTAYSARQRKDIPALKRVLSNEILEFFTEMGKVQNRTQDQMLAELADKPQASTAEVRGERITGGRATLEYKDETGGWKEMDFVKEDGGWKLTLPKAETSKRP